MEARSGLLRVSVYVWRHTSRRRKSVSGSPAEPGSLWRVLRQQQGALAEDHSRVWFAISVLCARAVPNCWNASLLRPKDVAPASSSHHLLWLSQATAIPASLKLLQHPVYEPHGSEYSRDLTLWIISIWKYFLTLLQDSEFPEHRTYIYLFLSSTEATGELSNTNCRVCCSAAASLALWSRTRVRSPSPMQTCYI